MRITSNGDWIGRLMVAWIVGLVAAVIVAEVAIALRYSGSGFGVPSKVTLLVVVPFLGVLLLYGGFLIGSVLAVIGIWLFESAHGLARSMRSPRP
jgi:hypothetical protein